MPLWSKLHPVFKYCLLLPGLALLFLYSLSATAATTGSAAANLITIQGSGAQCSFGDYYPISNGTGCTNAALNTYYSYWIEVPTGANQLVVQIFDADVNGTNDAQRGSFNTAVRYDLYAPGAVVPSYTGTCAAGAATCLGFNNINTNNVWRRLGPQINSAAAGLWELRVDMSNAVTTGDDVNALGINARDRLGQGATNFNELNIFYYTNNIGPRTSGGTGGVTNYPYITSGCTLGESNFDFDGNGSLTLTSRLGTVTNIANISGNGNWASDDPITIEGLDDSAEDYGIGSFAIQLSSGANYGNWYLNPQGQPSGALVSRLALNDGRAIRVYLPSGYRTIAGAPVKPYLAQWVAQTTPGNPNQFTITVRLTNPTAQAITSALVTGLVPNVPVGMAFLGERAGFPTHGTFTGPAVAGPYSWSIPTIAAGATAVVAYDIYVPTPLAVTTVTGTVGSLGTNAQWHEYVAGNIYNTGNICELRIGPGLTQAVVSRFEVRTDRGQGIVEWETASEVGTTGFYVERKDIDTGQFIRLNSQAVAGLGLSAPQGGSYRFEDSAVSSGEKHTYRLIEVEVDGTQRRYGPYRITVDGGPSRLGSIANRRVSGKSLQASGDKDVTPHKLKRQARKGEAKARKSEARVRRMSGKAGIKIGIEESGLYYLSAEVIAPLLDKSVKKVRKLIKNGKLSLTNQGVEVAWKAADSNSGLYFYGQKLDSINTTENVYWLKQGKGRIMAMADGGSPDPTLAPVSFTAIQHSEQDNIAVLVQVTPDYWYWDWLTNDSSKDFGFHIDGLAAGSNASLKVKLQGFSETGHDIDLLLNGASIGNTSWSGPIENVATFSFDAGLLLEEENTLTLTHGPGEPGSDSYVYLNEFDVSYPRSYVAVEDSLSFEVEGAPLAATESSEAAVLTVSGFSSAEIKLIDVSNPVEPVWVDDATVDSSSSHRVSFVPGNGVGTYLAAADTGIRQPAWLRKDTSSHLRNYQNRSDYVVITPIELESGAQALADHQSGKGLRAKVVLLEDIYDEFNDGIEDPSAIQRFLIYAWNNWRLAPRYAALVGDGSYDQRDLLGHGDSLMPAWLTATPDGLFAADNLYGRFAGEQKIAIGRIPVHDNTAMFNYVNKLVTWETNLGTSGLIQLTADNDDDAGSFTEDSNSLRSFIPAAQVASTDIYLKDIFADGGNINDGRNALSNGLDSGMYMLNYLGHGGMDRLAHEGLLTIDDVAGLTNTRTPIMNALSCVVNRYEIAGFDSLGEELLLHNEGGAVTVWSPTGLSRNHSAALLNQELYRSIFTNGEKVLGDAIVSALNNFTLLDGAEWMPKVYTLLGDPALSVQPGARYEHRRNARPDNQTNSDE